MESTSLIPNITFRVIGSLTIGYPVALKFSTSSPEFSVANPVPHIENTLAAMAAASTTAVDFFLIFLSSIYDRNDMISGTSCPLYDF